MPDPSSRVPLKQMIQNGHEANPGRGQIWRGRPAARGSEPHVKLMELKDKTTLSREEAAARLHAIADELASGNGVVIERETMRFVAHVPDQVNLKVEFEIEDDGTELEIELTW
jgi:amphi-Trp domain-containing protein